MGDEADVSVYDELHSGEDKEAAVERSIYYPLYLRVIEQVEKVHTNAILEVGCGSGVLAAMLMKTTSATYRGFDFSAVGVANAQRRTGKLDAFFVGDALDSSSYQQPYSIVVCTEVLEHISRDLDVVKMWKSGVHCICSVPNFDYPTHVRHFRHEDEVRARYGGLIDFNEIIRVPRPILSDKTFREYFRRLRWAREDPKKVFGLLGIKTFDWYAGWFVFVGRRRA